MEFLEIMKDLSFEVEDVDGKVVSLADIEKYVRMLDDPCNPPSSGSVSYYPTCNPDRIWIEEHR